MKEVKIIVNQFVANNECYMPDEGDKIFKKIEKLFNANEKVVLSFKDITFITHSFLNTAIGQLYGAFCSETIRNSLKVEGLSTDDIQLLALVIRNAKRYFVYRYDKYDCFAEEDEGEKTI